MSLKNAGITAYCIRGWKDFTAYNIATKTSPCQASMRKSCTLDSATIRLGLDENAPGTDGKSPSKVMSRGRAALPGDNLSKT